MPSMNDCRRNDRAKSSSDGTCHVRYSPSKLPGSHTVSTIAAMSARLVHQIRAASANLRSMVAPVAIDHLELDCLSVKARYLAEREVVYAPSWRGSESPRP